MLADVRTLVGTSVLTPDKELSLLARVNKEKFAAVTVGGRQVLLTPHGELPGGLFLDPSTGTALEVDHKKLEAVESSSPVSAAQATSMQAASATRDAIDREMQQYVKSFMPKGVVTTYGSSGAGTKVVCCLVAELADLSNYWAGKWMSEWTLEVPTGGSIGQLTGKVTSLIKIFELGTDRPNIEFSTGRCEGGTELDTGRCEAQLGGNHC